ncbi:uncharacterized protein LOC143919530 isoform X2 [Arctopsyche grandis]|uniref:uncharacterized protein LOC143919530 isoform X2 n=1 Tax=Arctopsyche grandis TaxID=121162 RepID=UPI00406D746D
MSDLLKTRKSFVQFAKRQVSVNAESENSTDDMLKPSNPKNAPPVMLRKKASFAQSGGPTLQKRGSFGAIEDLVQCPLCLEKLNTPKMLPCQHTFCLNCLYTLISENVLKCPGCQQSYNVNSPNFLENLPSNLYIDNLLKLLISPSSGPTVDRSVSLFAKPEPDTQTQKRCCKCQSGISLFSDHCCEHCKQIFCGVCWPAHITELKSQIGTLIHQLKSGYERLNHRLDGFKDHNEWLVNQINSTAEKKIDDIVSKKEMLLAQAEELLQNGEDSAKSLQNQLQSMESNVTKYVSKDFDTVTNDNEKVTAFMNFHRTTVNILNEVAHWGEDKFSFDQDNFCIEEDSLVATEAETDEPIAVEVKGIQNPLESPDSMTLYYRSRSFAPRMIWKKCPRPAGVGIAPWSDHLYICGTDSHHVIVLDRLKGKIIERISGPKILCPQSIAFSQLREEIYISDKWNHCVHVTSRSGAYLRTIGSKGSKEGFLRTPEGISLEPNENFLYVCDTGNDRVQCCWSGLDICDSKSMVSYQSFANLYNFNVETVPH